MLVPMQVCEPLNRHNHWESKASPQCPLDNQVAICQLVSESPPRPHPSLRALQRTEPRPAADILADALLIVAPLRLIQRMSAVDSTRRRLMIIFSTSIVTTYVPLSRARTDTR